MTAHDHQKAQKRPEPDLKFIAKADFSTEAAYNNTKNILENLGKEENLLYRISTLDSNVQFSITKKVTRHIKKQK